MIRAAASTAAAKSTWWDPGPRGQAGIPRGRGPSLERHKPRARYTHPGPRQARGRRTLFTGGSPQAQHRRASRPGAATAPAAGNVSSMPSASSPPAGRQISVSAVVRAAGVGRSFLYRHHDLRAQIHARAAAPSASPAATAASRQSLLADLANLQEHNQRLRRQNHRLAVRLSEVLGTEVFHESGLGHPGETGQLRTRITELDQLTRDLRQQLEEPVGGLGAARAANRDLIALANRKPARPGLCTTPVAPHAGNT